MPQFRDVNVIFELCSKSHNDCCVLATDLFVAAARRNPLDHETACPIMTASLTENQAKRKRAPLQDP